MGVTYALPSREVIPLDGSSGSGHHTYLPAFPPCQNTAVAFEGVRSRYGCGAAGDFHPSSRHRAAVLALPINLCARFFQGLKGNDGVICKHRLQELIYAFLLMNGDPEADPAI